MTAETDPSANRPGAAARQRAVELRPAHPVRTGLARVFGVHAEERAFRAGADGEETVARCLAKLGRGWHVLHAVPVGDRGSDIDHVVVGPAGVFTMNTKHHSGTSVWCSERSFLVDGQRTHYVRNARFEATRASDLLSAACGFGVDVESVIVVIARSLTIRGGGPAGVHVTGRKEAARWLSRRPATLTPESVAEVFARASLLSTWQPLVGTAMGTPSAVPLQSGRSREPRPAAHQLGGSRLGGGGPGGPVPPVSGAALRVDTVERASPTGGRAP